MPTDSDRWFERLAPGGHSALFDHIPNLLYFAKDTTYRIVAANRAFAARCGFSEVSQILGRTDSEIFPPELAEKYRNDDQRVITSDTPLTGIIELFPNSTGEPEWFVTDKIPLHDRKGKVIGLGGTVRSYEGAHAELQPYLELLPATEYLKEHFAEKIPVTDLATRLGMSVRQMERRFREAFKLSPSGYVQRLRIHKGCDLLIETDLQITEIALRLGFFDHSAFSRKFSALIGVSPRTYRQRHSQTKSR